jgi:hypothetical protein
MVSTRLLVTLSFILALLVESTGEAARVAEPAPNSIRTTSTPIGTAFTYQGQLTSGASNVSGTCDFQFSLWDSLTNPSGQIGSTQADTALPVANGLFAAALDFGAGSFDGNARWLQVAVACPTGSGSFATLSPRQELTPTPYAQYAMNAGAAGSSSFSVPGGIAFADSSLQTSAALPNIHQVALLRWYAADQVATFTADTNPLELAFDGQHVFVTDFSSGKVTKLEMATGFIDWDVSVGSGPAGIAYDGANLWVANYLSNNVMKLSPSNGTILSTISLGTFGPSGVAFDGMNIWVVESNANAVAKIQASTGAILGTFTVGTYPNRVAFDGTNIWVSNCNSGTVTKLLASTGAAVGTYGAGECPWGVAFDGTNMWVANNGSNSVTKFQASTGAALGTFAVGATPIGVVFDGANIWVANGGSNNVTKLLASTGTTLGTFSTGTNPYGLAFDGANVWVANSGTNTVSKL